MKKTKKTKTISKTTFIQDWGTYPNETLVSIGTTHAEIMKELKKKNYIKDIVDYYSSEQIKNIIGQDNGLCVQYKGTSLIWLKRMENKWMDIEILLHELHHAVFMVMGQGKYMADEMEAQAYQMEFLFREIRKKIWKRLKF